MATASRQIGARSRSAASRKRTGFGLYGQFSRGGTVMRFAFLNSAFAISLLLSPAIPLQLSAQQHTPRYKLIDLGTLGGPISYGSANGDGGRPVEQLRRCLIVRRHVAC